MNKITSIIIGLLIFSGQSLFGQLGRAVISYQPIYEEENNYFPHDHFVKVDMGGLIDTAVSIKVTGQDIIIKNIFNDGFTGHSVRFIVSPRLDIRDVQYREWTDVIDGSEIKYTVEKAILSMNENPFENEFITGHYTLQIRQDYIAGELLRKEGVRDTTSYRVFNGKFKIYSEQEKQKGRGWLTDQNEIKMGIKDSLGVYQVPDEFAQYKYGNESLKALLAQFEIDRSETEVKKKVYVTLKMLVDKNGRVNPESMTIRELMKSTNLLEQVRENQDLRTNWYPAIYKGKPVKSEVNLPIRIKE